MSLINKMLVDLEARKEGAAIVQPIYDDLRPAVGAKPVPAFARYRIAVAAVGAGVVLAAAYALLRPQPATPEPVAIVAKRAQTPALAAQPTLAPVPAAVSSAPVTGPATLPVVGSDPTLSARSPVATARDAQAKTPSRHAAAISNSPAAAVPASATPPLAAPALPAAIDATAGAATSKADEIDAPSAAAANESPTTRVAERASPTKAVTPGKRVSTPQADTEVRIEKTARVVTPRERALELHRTAAAQRKRGDIHAAEASLRAALAQDVNSIPARSDLVALQVERGRIPEALALLHDGLARAPAHYAFAQLAARLHVEQGNDVQALAVLEASRAHAARDADYLGFLATLYQRAQRYADAAVAYDAALALRPQEARWWVGSGIVREAQGDVAGAAAAYARAQGNPALPPALGRFVHERLGALKASAS